MPRGGPEPHPPEVGVETVVAGALSLFRTIRPSILFFDGVPHAWPIYAAANPGFAAADDRAWGRVVISPS